ncbi:hypothetical protein GGD62_004804 [Bradyrhizobium sp. ERR14]|nr:hypothetical protein [Bradyrhizobium sp. ERR14]
MVKLFVLSPGAKTIWPVFARPLKVGWMKSDPAVALPPVPISFVVYSTVFCDERSPERVTVTVAVPAASLA